MRGNLLTKDVVLFITRTYDKPMNENHSEEQGREQSESTPAHVERGLRPVVAIIGGILTFIAGVALGLFIYSQYIVAPTNQDKVTTTETTKTDDTAQTDVDQTCTDGADESATNGTFCSADLGLKFYLYANPLFGKVSQIDNVDIKGGTPDIQNYQEKVLGKSELAFGGSVEYPATPTRTATTYSVQITKSALINNVSFGSAGFFDASDRKLYNYTFYDDSDKTVKQEADYLMVSGQKVYFYSFGDVGYIINDFLTVVDDSLVEIKLTSQEHDGLTANPVYGTAAEVYIEPLWLMTSIQRVK